MTKPLTALLYAGLTISGCRQGPVPYGGRDQTVALAHYQDSVAAVFQTYLRREAAFRRPVPSNHPALVLFAPRPRDPARPPPPNWERISALADSLRGLADSLGITIELRDGFRLVLAEPGRLIPIPAFPPPADGYLFTPAGVPLELHHGVPAEAVLRGRLKAYAEALAPKSVPRAT
jgi:hypothetical protein